jgi:acetyl CoA:N6-hydroxylysine acetyl transferase
VSRVVSPPPTGLSVATSRGLLTLRPADPVTDLPLIHEWMHRTHVVRFWQQDWPAARLRRYLADQLAGGVSRPCVGALSGVPLSYWELYRPVADPVGRTYPANSSDIGVHVLIGDTQLTGKGLGSVLLSAVRAGLFMADTSCRRIVAEPDVRNVRSIRAFQRAGFRRRAEVSLPDKTAALMVAERTRTA